jgi:L-ascorbate metabolism protein UlaG (beta-lactamase superfamily)
MQIHHIRNATFVIHSKDNYILVDPMLSNKGEIPPFSYIKHKLLKNPTVNFTKNSQDILNKVTHCLITHSQTFGIKAFQHTDHLDKKGEEFLIRKNIPVTSIKKDENYLKKQGLNMVSGLNLWEKESFLDGYITAVPATHGYGWVHKLMANGAGYFIELKDEPTIYISGDTVLTADVKNAIEKFQPELTVVAAGNASIDIGNDLLMNIDEVIEFIKLSPKKVLANHMEALNHCPITREDLKSKLEEHNLSNKVFIPLDGEEIEFNS